MVIFSLYKYELDISPFILSGENILSVTIFGSLKNLLGPHHLVRTRGIVTPWSFKYAPEIQPPGTGYDILGYGMKEVFQLLECK